MEEVIEKEYLVVSEIDGEIKHDVIKANTPFMAMTKISFFGNYNVSEQEMATMGVYELGENLLIDMISKS